jgi:CheY-like chemotaxis protein
MKRILFIDDDVLALQLMAKITAMLGLQAILSPSPRRGLMMAAAEKPDIVVVDMQMDEMDGSEFVRRLRRLPGFLSIPILICTVGTGRSDEENARMAGADGLLKKPLGITELSRIIQAYAAA